MATAFDPARWSRRSFLLAGAATVTTALVGAAACGAPGGSGTSEGPASAGADPSGTGRAAPGRLAPADPAPPPTPPLPGAVEGAAIERALTARATAVLAAGGHDLDASGRRLISAIRDQHAAHVAALASSDPTNPNASPAPPASPGSPAPTGSSSAKRAGFATAVKQLLAAESKAATAHRVRALQAPDTAALLWGSLATSAAALGSVLDGADLAGDRPRPKRVTVAPVQARAPMPVVTLVAAEQQMVAQLHAVVYGYQLALGRLSGSSRDTAAAGLKRHRVLRDRLTARLIEHRADVPVAEPAYVPSTTPRNAASAGKLIRQLETALLPFCGLWLAAGGTPAGRAEALDQLAATLTVARHWGAAQPAWPGWRMS